jgi:predicted nucleic acid-binding protein
LTVYLVDTNLWLERLLDQVRSEEVGRFLTRVAPESLFITDFSFHSIGIVLDRLQRPDVLLDFVRDVFVEGGVTMIHLEPEDTSRLVEIISETKLDFDDAYQYAAAEKNDLNIVSFDSDFDRTERGRRMPAQIAVE